MKMLVLAGLAASVFWSPAANAAPFDRMDAGSDTGAFAGARFRIVLGGQAQPKFRAALTFAPMLRAHGIDGRTTMRLGEGVAFGFDARGPARLSLGGRPVASFTSGRSNGIGADRAGLSTGAAIGIGVGVAVVVGVLLFKDALDDASE